MKTLSALVLLIAGIAGGITPAIAQDTTTERAAKKTSVKKAPASKKAAPVDDNEKEPDTDGMQSTAFDCELGNKLTIYRKVDDEQRIALRWNKRVHEMTRVSTSTGAHRFEDSKRGLVWIGIPAKGILLDSKKGQQLANECKSAEQAATHAPSEQTKLGIAQ